MELHEKIFNAGVVGAGGAGFPAHVKANSSVEFMIANGAECEPLLHKDYELMYNFPEEISHGFELMVKSTNAKKGIFGLKRKNISAGEKINDSFSGPDYEMCYLGDFYPAGDEYELVYAATKRLIPPHGIPLDIGCVVNNVETLYNISLAEKGEPVTKKFITVNGAVKNPSSFFVPIGTTFRDVIKHAGGATESDIGIFVSGVMMGKLSFDLDEPITKTVAGLIILPKNHYLITRMERPKESMNRIGKSACDQCSYCTEFCPRYLLGYDVQPHKVMRSLVFTKSGKELWNEFADLCCACGLCSLYACPEDLYPREACVQSKAELKEIGVKYEQKKEVKVHPIHEGRRVPIKQLMKKLDLEKYDVHTPLNPEMPSPNNVLIPLKQHVGAPAKAVVKLGDSVEVGTLIGEIQDGSLGANVHSSINGKIINVSDDAIRIQS